MIFEFAQILNLNNFRICTLFDFEHFSNLNKKKRKKNKIRKKQKRKRKKKTIKNGKQKLTAKWADQASPYRARRVCAARCKSRPGRCIGIALFLSRQRKYETTLVGCELQAHVKALGYTVKMA
jgi:hypothetical protein